MILRRGSKGELVKTLQNFLGLNPSGVFDTRTENAVKSWQKKKGLLDDGIVGPRTWAAIEKNGLATTDNSERIHDHSESLTIKESFLPKDEYFKGPIKKEWLFLHHTAGWGNPYNTIRNWGNDTRGLVATEFVIGGPSIKGDDNKFDGEVVKAFPDGGYGWHLGTGNSSMHRGSVGIEVCNFGQLTKGGYFKTVNKRRTWIPLKADSFYTYVGVEAHKDQIVELDNPFRNFKHWHRYSEEQLKSLKELILYIANRDSIDVKKGLPDLIRKNGISAFDTCDVNMCVRTKGLWNHTNVLTGKVDMFPQQELIDLLLSL